MNAEVDQAFQRLEGGQGGARPTAPPRGPARPAPSIGRRLDTAVRQGIGDVRAELGRRWARRPEFGTRLHAALKTRLQGLRLPRGWQHQADQPLRDFPGADPRIMRLTVRQWFARNPQLGWLRDALPRKILSQRVGNLRADLLVRRQISASI